MTETPAPERLDVLAALLEAEGSSRACAPAPGRLVVDQRRDSRCAVDQVSRGWCLRAYTRVEVVSWMALPTGSST